MKVSGVVRKVVATLPHMGLASTLRYTVAMRRSSQAESVRVRLRRFPGISFDLRVRGSDRFTYNEVFVQEVYHGVCEALGDCRRILDLGANIGLASLYFSAEFPRAEILAIEANPLTFEWLNRNLAPLQAQHRASTRCCAAWSSDGFVAGDDGGAQDHFSRFSVRASPPAEVPQDRIPARRVGTLLDDIGWDEVDLIKIDIEGAEVELFAGDPSWIRRTRCLAVEFHGDSAQQCGWPAVLTRFGMQERTSPLSHTAIAVRS